MDLKWYSSFANGSELCRLQISVLAGCVPQRDRDPINEEAGHRGQAVRTKVSAQERVPYGILLFPWSTLNCQVAEAES